MKKYTLIYNSNCSKSKDALKIIVENKIIPEMIDYLSGELNAELIYKIKIFLKKEFIELVRMKEEATIHFLEKNQTSDADWIKFILEHPIVLERPILLSETSGIIARPPELILDFI